MTVIQSKCLAFPPQGSSFLHPLTVTKNGIRTIGISTLKNSTSKKLRTTNSTAHDGDAARDGEALRQDDGKSQKEEGKKLVHLARLNNNNACG